MIVKKIAVIWAVITLSVNIIHSADISGYDSGANNKTGNELKTVSHDSILGSRFFTGVDANYYPEMSEKGKNWKTANSQNLFEIFRANGINSSRSRLWTCDTGPGSFDYVLKIAKECKNNNIAPYVVVFLSDNWADYVKQPVPEKWKEISFDDKITAVREYSKSIAAGFRKNGIAPLMYEIGNEIDFGICGEFEKEWHNRFNVEYMKKNIWIKAAKIIEASQKGILEEDSDAKFILHLTQWWNAEFCSEFYKFMLGNNVRIDFLGLSFFPTANMSEKNDSDYFESQIKQLSVAVQKPVIICEYAYPAKKNFGGQFSKWNQRVLGYELNEKGQAQWIRDFLRVCRGNKYIQGAYYWSPEWYDSEMWEAFSLFNKRGKPKKGLGSFKTNKKVDDFKNDVRKLKVAFSYFFLEDFVIEISRDVERLMVYGEPNPPEGFAGPDPTGKYKQGIYVPYNYEEIETFSKDISLKQWIFHEMFHLHNRRTGEYNKFIDKAFPDENDPLVQWIKKDPYHRTFAREEAFINLITFADPARTKAQKESVRHFFNSIGSENLSIVEIKDILSVIAHD